MSFETIPPDLRGLRACYVCSLVKTANQFEDDGCDNCENFLQLKGDNQKVMECTSANFDGLIAAIDPENSWVCKWQRIKTKCRGMYAVSVSGSLPAEIIADLRSMGIQYRKNMRDTSK